MDCPNCGTYTQGAYCPQCGSPVMQYAPAPPPAPTRTTPPWIYVAVIAALAALGAGSFFLFTQLTGKKSDSANLPPSVSQSAAPPAGSSQPVSPSTAGANQSASTPTASTPSTPTPTTSSSAEIDAAVTKEFDDRAAQDMQKITISEDSWGARVSSKWIGIRDEKGGHPQPYTATEIKQEFDGLQQTYGDQLRILPITGVGIQEASYAHQHGWIAVVVNSDITDKQSAVDWCANAYHGPAGQCGEQHLDAPHTH